VKNKPEFENFSYLRTRYLKRSDGKQLFCRLLGRLVEGVGRLVL